MRPAHRTATLPRRRLLLYSDDFHPVHLRSCTTKCIQPPPRAVIILSVHSLCTCVISRVCLACFLNVLCMCALLSVARADPLATIKPPAITSATLEHLLCQQVHQRLPRCLAAPPHHPPANPLQRASRPAKEGRRCVCVCITDL